MLAIGLACFSILGAAREALYNKPGRSRGWLSPSTAAHFAVGSMRLLQVGRVFCSYVSSPPRPFTFITTHYKIAVIVKRAHSSQPLLSPHFSPAIANSKGACVCVCVCGEHSSGAKILPPFGFKTNKGSRRGKSDLPAVRVPDRTRQGLPPGQIDVAPAPLLGMQQRQGAPAWHGTGGRAGGRQPGFLTESC